MTTRKGYWLPTIPYNVIDAVNRVSLATGSCGGAMAGANANYNGHYVTVSYNDYRRYWVTEYFWAGRVVLARGTLEQCLAAAKGEYSRGALGTTVTMTSPVTEEQEAACIAAGFQPYSEEIDRAHVATWRTPLHDEVNLAIDLQRHGLSPAVGFLCNSATVEEYRAKLDAYREERRNR